MENNKKKSSEILSGLMQKTVDISKKAASEAKINIGNAIEKAKNDSLQKKLKKLNPVFPEQYKSKKFNLPNMIMIVDDAVPPQRESIKDYHRITCEKGKYLAKQPPILRNEPTSSQKTMNQTVKTMHRIALVFAMESCMKNAWKSTQTQRMQSCFFAMV